MISIHSEIQHSLGQNTALARMQDMVASLSDRFPEQVHQVKLVMADHRMQASFASYGYVITWKAEVFDDAVQLTGQIPDSAAPFRNKMEAVVRARVEDAVCPAPMRKSA